MPIVAIMLWYSWHMPIVAIMFSFFSFIALKSLKLFGFPIFRFSAYPMKVIPETLRGH
jgi:hypothetical protein